MEIGRKFLLLRELIDEYIVNYIYRAVISRRITKIRSIILENYITTKFIILFITIEIP